MEKTFDLVDLEAFERFYKVNFITKLCGINSANLIGTSDENGISNLAIFNSVTHIGANPPFMGFINQVNNSFFKKAHQTSAKYEKGISEFNTCKLTEQFVDDFPIPFVQESLVKIGLSFEEEHLIKCNQNILIVGKIQKVIISENLIDKDGSILLEKANATGVAGLNTYFEINQIGKMKFARP